MPNAKMLVPLLAVLALLGAAVSCADKPLEVGQPMPLAAAARPVVIDTDMAADDWMAMLYLLMHPQVDVRAITVTGAGEARCEPGVRNALDLAALAGRPDIPVACGPETPLQGDHVFPLAWRERVDNLLGLELPHNPNGPSDLTAAALLSQAARAAPGQVEILALGPLTNLGQAFELEADLAAQVAGITIMGGAVRAPGNVGPSSDYDNDLAEWNIFIDPYATRLVFESGTPILLVPLDATNQAPMTDSFLEAVKDDRTTPAADFVYRVVDARAEDMRAFGLYFWDPLAAVALTNPQVVTVEEMPLRVEEAEGPASGKTYIDEAGAPMRVATGTDRAAFERIFLDVLNGR